MGVCNMLLSILANGVFMLDSIKLFFSQKSDLKNRIRHKAQGASFNKLATYALSRLLVFFLLSLPVQVLNAEGIINQTTHLVNEDIPSQKAVVDNHVTSVGTEIVANENASIDNAITSIITKKYHPYLLRSDFQNRAEDLETLYKKAGNNLLWLGNAQAKKNIVDVLNLLENASVNGLNSTSYDTQTLRQKLPSALTIAHDNYKQLALYDTAISLSLLRFLHDLHYGRVNPKEINFNLKLREKKLIDLPALIETSLAQGTIQQLPESVEPKLKQYQKLKKALATYRLLAKNPAPFQLFVNKSINPGGNLPQAEELREFLSKVGDLPEEESDRNNKKSNRYTGKLVAGVKQFQLRNGINADGVLGKDTVAAINVPLSQRVTQIELAMERLRWLPEASAGASIIVNIPAFQLWVFDDVDEFDANMPNMRVVVGKALENQTPVLMAKMSFIDFMPYWNVPYNIVKKEILPKLMQNPGYLAGQNMELVATLGNETKAVAFTASSITQLKQGTLRIRQRPGKKNALGKVKFIFPNKSDVYLHDTPARALFSKSRRDYSHGCVRVANPDQLAEFALKNQWSKETIQQALNTPKTRRVILKKSIPVTIFYVTSFIDQYDRLAFYSDIYGYDAVLQEALNKSGDLSDEAIFAPPPEPIPVDSPEPYSVEAIKQIELIKPVEPIANYKLP
jgi:murein L,D-transpeptidase YcbB/YkuD